MIDYRLFFMAQGHIRGAAEFNAEGDAAAISHADTLRTGQAAELWNRARRVAAFPPQAANAPPVGARLFGAFGRTDVRLRA